MASRRQLLQPRRGRAAGIAWLAALVGALASAEPAAAHRLDELLQATRLAIEGERIAIEIDLTAGANVAAEVFRSIDINGDGRIAEDEGETYARTVLAATRLTVDGRSVPVTLASRRFPVFHEMAEGIGTVRLAAAAAVPAQPGRHELSYVNAYLPDKSAYLANVLVPSDDRVEIVRQQRDELQRTFTLQYRVGPSRTGIRAAWFLACAGAVALLGLLRRPGAFVRRGMIGPP